MVISIEEARSPFSEILCQFTNTFVRIVRRVSKFCARWPKQMLPLLVINAKENIPPAWFQPLLPIQVDAWLLEVPAAVAVVAVVPVDHVAPVAISIFEICERISRAIEWEIFCFNFLPVLGRDSNSPFCHPHF